MNKFSYIIGYSGHAYVVIDILLSCNIGLNGYCEKQIKENNPYQLNYLGDESYPEVFDKLKYSNVYLGIGKNISRKVLYQKFSLHNISMPFAVHKSAVVSKSSCISQAVTIMPGAVINSQVFIGNGVICNTSSIVEHESIIGEFSHIAPGAVLAGGVIVGENTFIGANSVVREGVKIGKNVIIGAGTVVIQDIPDDCTVVGNPQKII